MPFPFRKFRRFREAKGSREDFAKLSGVEIRTLEGLEQGRRPNPTQDTLEKLAAALDVDCRFFFSPDDADDVAPPAEVEMKPARRKKKDAG